MLVHLMLRLAQVLGTTALWCKMQLVRESLLGWLGYMDTVGCHLFNKKGAQTSVKVGVNININNFQN